MFSFSVKIRQCQMVTVGDAMSLAQHKHLPNQVLRRETFGKLTCCGAAACMQECGCSRRSRPDRRLAAKKIHAESQAVREDCPGGQNVTARPCLYRQGAMSALIACTSRCRPLDLRFQFRLSSDPPFARHASGRGKKCLQLKIVADQILQSDALKRGIESRHRIRNRFAQTTACAQGASVALLVKTFCQGQVRLEL